MKYIIFNDINDIFKRNKRLLIFSSIIYLFYSFYICRCIQTENNFLYYSAIGFNTNYIALLTLYFFDHFLYFYLGIFIYLKDLSIGYDYLFTRIKFKKWNFFKIISIILSIITLKIIQSFIFFIFTKWSFNQSDLIALLNYILILLNSIILMLETYIYRGKTTALYVIILVMLIFVSIVSWYYLLNNKTLIFLLILLFINIIIFINKNKSDLKLNIGG